jgi:predicted nucleic acid-binding protein
LIDLSKYYFVTTSYVLLECANHSARKPYRVEVSRLRKTLGVSGDLYEPTPKELSQAWDDFERKAFGTASVVDLTSFALMKRIRARKALTNDHHFLGAGFEVLIV